jgi:Domain of unknown function (DUF4304)
MRVQKPLVDTTYEYIVRSTAQHLSNLGFKRRQNIIYVRNQDGFGVVEFQRSLSNSSSQIKFTINVGVIIDVLLDPRVRGNVAKRPATLYAHVRQRLGRLLPERNEKWWTIVQSSDTEHLAAQVLQCVLNGAIPFLRDYSNIDNVVSMWKQGRSPGLTDAERREVLSKLER